MPTTHRPSVRIRMYRQGLGDCFLLTFSQTGKDNVHMMIDCGLLQGTEGGGDKMRAVVKDIESVLKAEQPAGSKPRIDVVVLTHEHADHISGFSLAKAEFAGIEFGEVWAAWVDDETHPKYKAVRERFKKQVTGLQAALAKMTSPQFESMKQTVQSLLNHFFEDDVLGASSTTGHSASWDFAIAKSSKPVRYFTPGMMFSLPGFDSVRVYILGPSEDFESFTDMNPPDEDTYRSKGSKFHLMESFYAAVGMTSDPLVADSFKPFEERMQITPEDAATDPFFVEHYLGSPSNTTNDWRKIDDDWLSLAGGLGLNLDTYTNNTCLAIAMEFVNTGKVLLFPGDAQYSNWLSWQKLSWQIPDASGANKTCTVKDLLARTVFYKVGHHGSHNATLKAHGLEMMLSPDLMAMIPVDRVQAKNQKSKTNPNGWEMPEVNLFARLKEKTRGRVIIADEPDETSLTARCKDQTFIKNVKFDGEFIRDSSKNTPEALCVELMVKG